MVQSSLPPSLRDFLLLAEHRVVIIGGGIIGASVAYYLSERGLKATVVEREEVACAASGNAGTWRMLIATPVSCIIYD